MKLSLHFPYILLLLISASLYGQRSLPLDYFRSPLDIPLSVTGSFGEIRPNHFHSGADFKVQGKEGLPVFAVADGWVSRIKISPVGFGNALYIDHPNGFTSVYGHLFGYNDTISTYAHKMQYVRKSFEVDLFPITNHDTLWIKKGDLIGFAGNSGSSFGAHLHFELRNTASERIINPLLFGFD
jgi:murein DD-endopeptidase MepM/ murein hydrolase activator NlpD